MIFDWLLRVLQFGNVVLIMCQVIYHYMPENGGIWIMFALILWEGTLGGMGYVHTFYQISQKVSAFWAILFIPNCLISIHLTNIKLIHLGVVFLYYLLSQLQTSVGY